MQWVTDAVNHAITILEKDGETVKDAVSNGLKFVQSVTGRDLTGILTALQAEQADFSKIIADIRAEFGL